jgi:prepilin-type N-terminal cleavage/methylation domain-containing protein
MKRFHSRQKGFTLIELMIVILIIAILVAIAVPVYLAATNSAKRRTCQSNQRTIDSSVNAYNGFYDSWPNAGTVLDQLGPTWLKRDPSCGSSTAPGTYALTAGSPAGAPPTTACPGTVGGHTL